MASQKTLLQLLQARTIVDCDTMDVEVPKSLGPFVDCTSNQAIAFFELQKPVHKLAISKAVELSKTLTATYPDVTSAELAVELAMVNLQLEISRHVSGFVHVQTNPYYSYNTEKTIRNALRIVALFKVLDADFDVKRVCIKIPSTWEGIQACRLLERAGVATLATTLFTIEQAALAGEVGCHYIAPYVNELKVHFEPGFIDHKKAQKLCLDAQRYYEKHNVSTLVLPASLTSTDEIMALAGVHHITIAPALLEQLAALPASSLEVSSLFDFDLAGVEVPSLPPFADDQAAYRLAFTRSVNGEGERKLGQAINIFCDMQTKLEKFLV